MAKRRKRREREKVTTTEYRDAEGNVLVLRDALSAGTISKLSESVGVAASSADDVWRRRTEMLFERLAVSWEISGLPLTDQKLLIGRLRMADADTQAWVRTTIASHVDQKIPELDT